MFSIEERKIKKKLKKNLKKNRYGWLTTFDLSIRGYFIERWLQCSCGGHNGNNSNINNQSEHGTYMCNVPPLANLSYEATRKRKRQEIKTRYLLDPQESSFFFFFFWISVNLGENRIADNCFIFNATIVLTIFKSFWKMVRAFHIVPINVEGIFLFQRGSCENRIVFILILKSLKYNIRTVSEENFTRLFNSFQSFIVQRIRYFPLLFH